MLEIPLFYSEKCWWQDMCIFLRLGRFSLHTLEDTALLLGIWVDSSTRGDTASSDEVVIVNVHNVFLGILGFPVFVRRDTALRRGLFVVFCSEVPLLSEEYWWRMFVFYLCIIDVSVCHNEIPLLGEQIILHFIVYISISRIPVLIVSRCMRCRKEGSMQKNNNNK